MTGRSYFFHPLSNYLRLNKNLNVTVVFFTIRFCFPLGTVLIFISEVIYSIPYHYHYNTKTFILFIVLFAKNCTNQIKSNYLNSHGEEAQEKPPGL